MEFMSCEGCKYIGFNFDQYPCKKCKGTSVPGCDEYKKRHNYFEQEGTVVSQPDNVNHPSHYEPGKFECIDVMCEAIGLESTKAFCICNAFKYIYRSNKKHETPVDDVKKAVWYLNKFLELEGETDD